jgi:hypothetical protein
MLVRLPAASVAPELLCCLVYMQLPMVSKADVLPEDIRRMLVEGTGDERDVLERGRIEVCDDKLT